MMRLALLVLVTALAPSCSLLREPPNPDLRRNAAISPIAQGLFGVQRIDDRRFDLDPSVGSVPTEDDILPFFGGVYGEPITGDEDTQFGFEVGFTFTYDGSDERIDLAGGGSVPADVELVLFDLFGGFYVNHYVGRLRLYAGAGPLLQFGRVELVFEDPPGSLEFVDDHGFGYGYYARGGVELEVRPGLYVGPGVRFIDSFADLGGDLDDFEYEALQLTIGITTGF